MIKMRVYVLMASTPWARRMVENICKMGFASWIWGVHEFQFIPPLAEILDDPERHLPKDMPKCDLILSLGLPAGMISALPVVAKKTDAKAVITPIDDPMWVRLGLQRQIEKEFARIKIASAFPKPFCSLRKTGDVYIDAFAEHFGKPKLEMRIHGTKIIGVKVRRGAPCGSTWYIADKLKGVDIKEAERKAGLEHHNYPCLASMQIDPVINDTLMHLAGYIIMDEVKKSLKAQWIPYKSFKG